MAIDPKKEDVGRRVVYRDGSGKIEEGTIMSFNENYVHVRYGPHGAVPNATRREDLDWAGTTRDSGVTAGVKFHG